MSTAAGCALGLYTASFTYMSFRYPHSRLGLEAGFYRDGGFTLFFAVLWLFPGLSRRPAARLFAGYWTIYRILLIIPQILIVYGVDVGYCLFHVVVLFGYSLGKVVILFSYLYSLFVFSVINLRNILSVTCSA